MLFMKLSIKKNVLQKNNANVLSFSFFGYVEYYRNSNKYGNWKECEEIKPAYLQEMNRDTNPVQCKEKHCDISNI